jgi:hypothetical protein
MEVLIIAKIAEIPDVGFFAVMEEIKGTLPDRWFKVMDETGNHEMYHESLIYSWTYYRSVTVEDANDIKILLKELNLARYLQHDLNPIIRNWNEVYNLFTKS